MEAIVTCTLNGTRCRTAIDAAVDAAHATAERTPKIAPQAPKL